MTKTGPENILQISHIGVPNVFFLEEGTAEEAACSVAVALFSTDLDDSV